MTFAVLPCMEDCSEIRSQSHLDGYFHDTEGTAVNHNPSTARPTLCPPHPAPLTRKVRCRDQLSIIIGPPVVLLFDLAVPCLIYYNWLNTSRSRWKEDCRKLVRVGQQCPMPPAFSAHILGVSIISFGAGELYILLVRCYRLVRQHKSYAPILSIRKWELDATAWVYASALIVALVPFVVSTSVGDGIPWLFLYAPSFLVAYLEIWALITLLPFNIPVRVDSDPTGTPVRPLVYYAAEDFMAVDGCQGQEFRRRYLARYQMSPIFRQMILELTLLWIAGCTIFLGCVSAVIWNFSFEIAFGSTLGLLFAWVILWALLTYLWINLMLRREGLWFQREQARRNSSNVSGI